MTNRKNVCPICEMGTLNTKIEKESHTYKHVTSELDLHYSECDVCCSQTATSTQLRQNKRAMIKFQKDIDGLLSAADVKYIRLLLGLSIRDAGAIFGGGPVAFSKYENDDLIQSTGLDSALRLAQINPDSIKKLAAARKVAYKSPRAITTKMPSKPTWNKVFNLGNGHKSHNIPIASQSNTSSFFIPQPDIHSEVYSYVKQ